MRSKPYFTKADLFAEERPPIHPTAVYDINQAAAITDLSPTTIRTELAAGNLRCCRIKTSLRFLGEHLLEWLKANEVARAVETEQGREEPATIH